MDFDVGPVCLVQWGEPISLSGHVYYLIWPASLPFYIKFVVLGIVVYTTMRPNVVQCNEIAVKEMLMPEYKTQCDGLGV